MGTQNIDIYCKARVRVHIAKILRKVLLFPHIDAPEQVIIARFYFEFVTSFALNIRPGTVKYCVLCSTQLYLHEKFLVILDTSVEVLLHLFMEFQVFIFGFGGIVIEIDFFTEFMFLRFKSVNNEQFLHFNGIRSL